MTPRVVVGVKPKNATMEANSIPATQVEITPNHSIPACRELKRLDAVGDCIL